LDLAAGGGPVARGGEFGRTIYHALEHVASCAGVLYGEGSGAARRWTEGGRQALLTGGGPALAEQVAASRRETRAAAKRQALADLERSFACQAEHLGYAERLTRGQSIGSGLVEGACKQVIGRRMKQTGARWRVRRANRMATLCCTFHSDSWDAYWLHRLN
jgi:hypothetical protein